MSAASSRGKRRVIVAIGAVLFVLHYDFWLWDDRSLVLGFLPVGLAWHAGLSIVASLAWAAAIAVAWPDELEEWASEADAGEPGAGGGDGS